MAGRHIVAIGASTGGLEALRRILQALPADFPAALLVVVHTPPDNPGALPLILARTGHLPAAHARNGEPIRGGRIYVAPPDRHLLVDEGHVLVTQGPKENRFRPAVDPLFRTVASWYGPRAIGIILSGGLNDGVSGLARIKRRGGVAVVQQPADALAPSMPLSAIRDVAVDHIATADEMAPLLVRLVAEPPQEPAMDSGEKPAPDPAEVGANALNTQVSGPPSTFTCPDCGGALWEIADGELLRYRCHVGHGFTDEGLSAIESEAVEQAMWYALRVLEEHAALHRRLADNARLRGMNIIAVGYEERAVESQQRAATIRQALVDSPDAERTADAVKEA